MHELWFTLGPVSRGKERELFLKGANGVRLTFSYRTPDYQEEQACRIREIAEKMNHPCRIVADLAGEKFRLGEFKGDPSISIAGGTSIRVVMEDVTEPTPNDPIFPVKNDRFYRQALEGSRITVGDGSAVFLVSRNNQNEIHAEMIADGVVDQMRGLVIQGKTFQPECLTEKDISHLEYIAASSEFDALALSFVNSAQDVKKARNALIKAEKKRMIIAKIETESGIENINEIAREADWVMAARGDLALAMPWIDLPGAVRSIASACKTKNKRWILATQLMEGLERFSIPTRPEICDLAHWLEQKCSGVMLSYETAFGKKPEEAVECVYKLIQRWG